MSSRSSSRPKSPPSFVTAVALCGIRRALRPFLRRKNLTFFAALIVPVGTAEHYRRAASRLLQGPGAMNEYGNDGVTILTVDGSKSDPQSLLAYFKNAHQVVIVTENADHLKSEVLAGIDLVVGIDGPAAEHFFGASVEAKVPGMTREYAEFLTTQSFETLLLAVRRTRPLANSIRQMKRVAAQEIEKELAQPRPESGAVRLEDLHGYGAAKDWGLQLAKDLDAWRRQEITWEDVDRGALLYGPPGCGKTSYAKALAASCNAALVLASAAKWQARGHLGDYLKAMRSAFDEAKKLGPSVLFIDEFDSFGDRDSPTSDDHHRDYRRQVINGLLECLDPSEGREGVVVIGATNNPDVIDKALLRSGRLETLIEIPMPDAKARVGILRHHMRGQFIDGNLKRFAAATRGWSGADIEKLARDVRRIARRRNLPVNESMLLEAMPERYVLTAEELRHTSVHEAGHAIIGALLKTGTLRSVSVERDVPVHGNKHVGGRASFDPPNSIIRSAVFYDDSIATLLGGIAAESVVFGYYTDGAGGDPTSDLALASDLATQAERQYGLGTTLTVGLGEGHRPLERLRERGPELRSLVEARLRKQLERAIVILTERRSALDRLVEILMSEGHASGHDVMTILSENSDDDVSVAR